MSAAYDFNTGKGKRDVFSAAMGAVIDASICDVVEKPRDYLGASQIGDTCKRRIQYQITGAPGAPFTAQTRRIFARGHIMETMVAGWLRGAGFLISTEKKDGNQHGFLVADGRFGGHCDGVIIEGPAVEGLAFPCLWENKALGSKGWKDVVKNGIPKSKPQYADQGALYQAYLDLDGAPALFTIVNSDTMEMHYEAVGFDTARAQAASDRAVLILRATAAGELLPRVSDDPTGFPCGWCQNVEHCFSATPGLGPRRPGVKVTA